MKTPELNPEMDAEARRVIKTIAKERYEAFPGDYRLVIHLCNLAFKSGEVAAEKAHLLSFSNIKAE